MEPVSYFFCAMRQRDPGGGLDYTSGILRTDGSPITEDVWRQLKTRIGEGFVPPTDNPIITSFSRL